MLVNGIFEFLVVVFDMLFVFLRVELVLVLR